MRLSLVWALGVLCAGCVQTADPQPGPPPPLCPDSETGCAEQPDDFVIVNAASDNVFVGPQPTGFTTDGLVIRHKHKR
jgi:hypothetical protein